MKQQLKIGVGFDAHTTQGPLINENAIQKVILILFCETALIT